MFESIEVEVGSGWLYKAKAPWWNRDTAKEQAEKLQSSIHNGSLSVEIVGEIPLFFADTRLPHIEQYWASNFSKDEVSSIYLDYLKLEISHYSTTHTPNGVKNEVSVTLWLSNAVVNGRGTGRSLDVFKTDDETSESLIQGAVSRFRTKLRNNEYDLTSEWDRQQNIVDKANKIISDDLPEYCSRSDFIGFCQKHGLDSEPDDLGYFYSYYRQLDGFDTLREALRVKSLFRFCDAENARFQGALEGINLPLCRADYEMLVSSAPALLRLKSDHECLDHFSRRYGILSDNVSLDNIHAFRGAQVEAEFVKAPVKKGAQLWEQCECGEEPVYLPLHKCDKCWPTEG